MNTNKTAIALSTGLLMTTLTATGMLAHSDSGTTQQTLPESATHMPNNESMGVGGVMGMQMNVDPKTGAMQPVTE